MSTRAPLALILALTLSACAAGAPPAAPPAATAAPTPSASPPATPAPAATPAATVTITPTDAADAPVDLPMVGSIAFRRYDDNSVAQLWIACADLTRATQVPTPSGLAAGWAAWSPDGQRLAFNAGRDDPDVDDAQEPWDIYTVERDGSDLRGLTKATALLGNPDYSPDGTLIAYDSTELGREGIWVMNAADGGDPRQVAARPDGILQDYAPRFSPDGQHLLFIRYRTEDQSELWIVGIDGGGLRRVPTEGIVTGLANWSPDGKQIAFEGSQGGSGLADIWSVAPDGTGLTNLTKQGATGREGFSEPVWSPDGSMIMMNHGLHPGPSRLGLAVMRADGTGMRWVEDGHGFEHGPDWTAEPC
jgi:Tol biopolymer transport system component